MRVELRVTIEMGPKAAQKYREARRTRLPLAQDIRNLTEQTLTAVAPLANADATVTVRPAWD